MSRLEFLSSFQHVMPIGCGFGLLGSIRGHNVLEGIYGSLESGNLDIYRAHTPRFQSPETQEGIYTANKKLKS